MNWMQGARLPVALLAAASLTVLASCNKPAAPAASTTASTATASAKPTYTIAWTIYAGWMPWPYAQSSGILKKWADKYNININLVQVNDYVESLNQYAAGKIDGVTSTTMDALTIPAAGGVDTTVLMIGDYSNGNDGVILKGSDKLSDIKGRPVNLVEASVSDYLLSRALETAGLKNSDVKRVNTSDADIVAAYSAADTKALVTWNPQLSSVKAMPQAHEVFDSSKIPGEIVDTLIVNSAKLQADPNLGKALTGAWYETLAAMEAQTPDGAAARTEMAKASGTDLPGFESQLKTTFLYDDPKKALAETLSPDLVTATDKVRKFSFASGLFGQGATSVDAIGIQFPGGKTLGDTSNIKLRFDPTFVQAAADGTL